MSNELNYDSYHKGSPYYEGCKWCEGTGIDEVSNCCGAKVYYDLMICSECKEHCDYENCGECN